MDLSSTVIQIPSKDDKKIAQEKEFLLQQKLVETKMKQKGEKMKKDKKICILMTFFAIILLFIFGLVAILFYNNKNLHAPNESPFNYIAAEKDGIAKSRQIRDHDIDLPEGPMLNEFRTSYYGFLKDSNVRSYDSKGKQFLQNPAKNEFFEIKKNGDLADDGSYGLFIIEKNHKNLNESIILQYSKFDKECFDENSYCLIRNDKMKYLSFAKFKEEHDGDEIQGLSTDFILLIVKNMEEFEDQWDSVAIIKDVKFVVVTQMKDFFKANAIDAVFVGNFANENGWIKEIKKRMNIRPFEFSTKSNKSNSFCGNQWIINSVSTPNFENSCIEKNYDNSTVSNRLIKGS